MPKKAVKGMSSMRFRVTLVIMLIILAITAANYLSSLTFTRNSITDTMEQELALALDIADSIVTTKIGLLKSYAETVAARLTGIDSDDEMTAVMAAQMEEFDEFISLTVYDREGLVIHYGAPVNHDVFLMGNELIQLAFSGMNTLSSPHFNGDGGDLIIHVFVPLGKDTVLSGTIPGMIFSDILSQYRLWQTGSIFMVDSEGTFVANYRSDLVLEQRNLIKDAETDLTIKTAGEFYQEMLSNDEPGSGQYTFEGKERLCVYKRVTDSVVGWRIGVAAPLEESPQRQVRAGLLLSSALFLLIGLAVSVFASASIARPYSRVKEQNADIEAKNTELETLNMTVKKQAEALQDEYNRAKLLLDATPLACRLMKKMEYGKFELFDCNEESVKLFGFKDQQEFMERYFETYPAYQPDGQPSIEEGERLFEKAFTQGRCVSDFTFQMPDGTPIPTEVTLVRVRYGNDYVIAGYTRDLREHEKMINEINRQNEIIRLEKNLNEKLAHWYKSILDAVPFPITVTDKNMNWTFVNKAVEDFLGTKSEEMLGRPCNNWNADICNTDKCGISCVKRGIKRTHFKQAESSYQVDVEILKDMDGNTSGYIEVVVDVTALQEAVENMDAALNDARLANQAKSDFLAKMSHEMRTPLNAIIGLSELILEDDAVNEETRLNIEKVSSAGDILLSTVNDILDISKIEAGKLELVPVRYDMPSLLNDTVTQSIMYIGEKPIQFVLNIADTLPAQLYGDDLRIKQMFNNLLSNAFKYTKEGTVELGVRCERDASEPETIWMTAWVKDTGIGIRPDKIESLFDDFMQADIQINRSVAGTGLGLSITKKMAELMGGSISVKSDYGSGCTFTIRLKQGFATDALIGSDVVDNLKSFKYSEHKRRRNAHAVRSDLSCASVLFVDDNLTNLDVARGLMKPYGMKHVDCVTGGKQAIRAVREERVQYSVIFMDHMMPEMDGIEATRLIREIGTDYAKNVPIIACTANAITGNEQMFIGMGFQAFLSKPIDINRLDDILRRWVQTGSPNKANTKQANTAQGGRENESLRAALENAFIPGLDIPGGLKRFGGDETSYMNVLRSYANHTGASLDQIKTVDRHNLAEYAIIVHGIKGASRGICAETAGALAEHLEKAAKLGDLDFVTGHHNDLLEQVHQLIAHIRDLIERLDPDEPKPKKDMLDREALLKLMQACDTYDMDSVDAIMKEIMAYDYETDSVLAGWLKDSIAGLQFSHVVQRIADILGSGQEMQDES